MGKKAVSTKEMKQAIRRLHKVYYSVDPFQDKESFIKFHNALEDCFNSAEIDVTKTNMPAEEQFVQIDPDNPPQSLADAWEKAQRGEI